MATLTTNWQLIDQELLGNTGYGNVYVRTYAKYNSQSVSNNSTNVSVETRVYTDYNGTWYSNSGTTYNVQCTGLTTKSGNCNGSYSSGESTLGTLTGDVYHNSDGTKSITVASNFSSSPWGWNATASGSATLPSIPRRANLTSAPDFNDEGNPTITYSNPAGNSVSGLVAGIFDTAGSVSYASYRNVNKTGTLSYTFNLTSAERTALRQACTGNSMAVKFYLRTYIGGDYYYSSIQKTMTIVNGNPTFNDYAFEDTNSTTVALTGNNQNVIKGYSNVTATVSTTNKAIANKEASMSKYRFSCGTNSSVDFNYSSSSDVSGTINGVSDGIFTLYAIDSRGNSTPVVKQANDIIDYSDIVKGNINVSRSNGVSEETTLSFSGSWWNDNFGNTANSITAEYKFKKTSDSSFPATSTPLLLTVNNNNFSFSGLIAGDDGNNGFNINYSYDIQVVVKDELSTATFTVQLSSGIPHIAYAHGGVSIMGKYNSSNGGLFQVAGKEVDYIVESGTSGIWQYRKWNSGLAECWGTETRNMTTSNDWGTLSRATAFTINYPFEFIEVPQETFGPSCGYTVLILTHGQNTTTNSCEYNVAYYSSGVTMTLNLCLYVRGKWK